MLRKFSILTISFITLFLVGCAGAGGSDNNSGDSSSSNSGSNTPTPVAKNVTGKVLVYTSGGSSYTSGTLDSNTNIDKIIVDGVSITVTPSGMTSPNFVSINDNLYGGTTYKDSKFGFVINGSKAYLYAQGNITDASSMPTTGTASYTGNAVISTLSSGLARDTATVAFDVDFASKTLAGTLTHSSGNLILEANINGNTFSGTSSDSTTVNGQFNGAAASELTGTLTNGGVYGSFGAKQ